MKAAYPTIIWEDGGLYYIKAPDVRGCLTSGTSIEDAIEQMRDALAGCLCVHEDMEGSAPKPSKPSDIIIDEAGGVLALVDVDTIEYRKATDTRAVRKNVSMPAWMSYLADKAGLNCSQLLQDAIRNQLQLSR